VQVLLTPVQAGGGLLFDQVRCDGELLPLSAWFDMMEVVRSRRCGDGREMLGCMVCSCLLDVVR